jgi:hypothetical protein
MHVKKKACRFQICDNNLSALKYTHSIYTKTQELIGSSSSIRPPKLTNVVKITIVKFWALDPFTLHLIKSKIGIWQQS